VITSIKKFINTTKFKVFLLFIVAFVPRIFNLGGHVVFVDEITWMSRAKDVYAAVRTLSWSPYNTNWWLSTTTTEAIGLPVTFLSSLTMTYLSPGYSIHSLNIMKDFVAARLPVVILGTFFIPVFYLLLKKFIDDKLAFVVSLLIALDPIAIALSRWFQHDTALMAFSVFALMLFLVDNSWISLIFSSFFTSMAILTKPQGFLIVFTLALFYLISVLTKKKVSFKRLLIWLVLSSVFTILFFPYLWSNPIGNMLKYLATQVSYVSWGNLTYFNGAITSAPPWYYYFAIFPFRVPESVLLGFLVGLVIFILNIKNKLSKNKLFQMILIYSVLYMFLMSSSNKKLGIRYLLGIWPYMYLIAASGLIFMEKFIHKPFKKVYWLVVLLFPIWGILKFSPVYYDYYNHFISPQRFQSLESVAYCDSVKPAIEYLGPKLHNNIKIMLLGCDAAINYYTGYTIDRVQSVAENPDYIIEEYANGQKIPDIYNQIKNAGYKEIKEIDFRGLILAKIYSRIDE
jgi:hypothetical protein